MKPRNTPLATALTTTAVSTGALFALQHHADASIIYSGAQNLTASFAGTAGFSNKTFEGFGSIAVERFNQGALFGEARFSPVYGGGFVPNASGQLKKLAAGAVISAPQIATNSSVMLRSMRNGVVLLGTWANGQTGLAGFEASNGDLGWVRLEWTSTDSDPRPNKIVAIDWAYDDVPGEAIQAGSVPEPSTPALLALAASGAAFLRRKRGKF